MTAGSASVSKDSPPAFNNILAYGHEVVSWIKRLVQCTARDVVFCFNTYAEAADGAAIGPHIVIVARGGRPNLELLKTGPDEEHVISAWDVISGDVKPAGNILI